MMEYDLIELKEKIDNYFTGIISKTELGKWASYAYYDLLKGGYVECEKIVLYPFLKEISTFHLEENDIEDIYPCSEESVKTIQDIVSGKQNFDFDIQTSLSGNVYDMFRERLYFEQERRNVFLEMREAMAHCFETNGISKDCAILYLEKITCMERQENTIQGLLEQHIFRLLKAIIDNETAETSGKTKFKLFAQKSEQNNLIEERLLKYLDSYIGNKNFHLLVSYKNGEPNILLIV